MDPKSSSNNALAWVRWKMTSIRGRIESALRHTAECTNRLSSSHATQRSNSKAEDVESDAVGGQCRLAPGDGQALGVFVARIGCLGWWANPLWIQGA